MNRNILKQKKATALNEKNKEIADFFRTNAPIAVLTRKQSSLNFRKLTTLGFLKGFFSPTEFFALLLPMQFSLKRKYLSRQWEFLDKEARLELKEYLTDSGDFDLFGNSFTGPNYAALLELIREVVLSDQYHAKQSIKKDSIVVDAGANIGVFSVFAATLASEGLVFAFEPTASTFSFLKKNTEKYQNVTCFEVGLGETRAERNILNKGAGSGDNVMQDSPFLNHSKYHNGIFEKTEITTIDFFVSEKKIPRVDFIKIDTEGYEAKILAGAKETIKKFKPVIAMSAYHNATDKDDLPRIVKDISPDYVCELFNECEEDFICYVPSDK